MSQTNGQAPRRHRFTVDDYYRMGQAEIFGPEERVELVDGDVIDVPKLSSQCAGTLDYLAKPLTIATRKSPGTRGMESRRLGSSTRNPSGSRGTGTRREAPIRCWNNPTSRFRSMSMPFQACA